MEGFRTIEISHETEEILRTLTPAAAAILVDVTTAKVLERQLPGVDNYRLIGEVISEEATRISADRKAQADMIMTREKVDADFRRRLDSPVSSVEGSEDPSTVLDKITRRIMAEKNLGYSAALSLAQEERADVAALILNQIDSYRRDR